MIDIRLQGFNTPPHGLISILQSLDWPARSCVHVIDPLNNRPINVASMVIADHTEHRFVVINTHEGASYHWFDRLIPEINSKSNIPHDNIVIRSSCLYSPQSPVGHVGSIVDYVTDTVSEYPDIKQIQQRDITHHYVCLNNQHRWQRLELIKILIDLDLIRYGRVSYLATPSDLPAKYRDFFPMILDRNQVTWAQGHDIGFPALQGAAINVITESCYERSPHSDFFETHHLPGLTEKTFKSILLSQFPIFVAPMLTVQCYRDLGFDAFDDVIDHGYDQEPDPEKRLRMIALEIQRVCDRPLEDLQRSLDQRRDRFQRNLDRFRWFASNHRADLPKWQKWLDDWKRLHVS